MSSESSNEPTLSELGNAALGDQIKQWRLIRQHSQLELALQCDTSARHISFIETGKANPSRELLLRLLQGLEVPLRVQNTMLISSGYAPMFERTGISEPEMKQVMQMLENMVRINNPYPSMLIDRRWDILYCNHTFERMCEVFAVNDEILTKKPFNLLRMFLNREGFAPSIENFPEVYYNMTSRALGNLSTIESDGAYKDLLEQIEKSKPTEGPSIEADEQNLVMPLRLKKGEHELNLFAMTATLGAPLNITLQEIQMEFALPMDQKSQKFLEELAAS